MKIYIQKSLIIYIGLLLSIVSIESRSETKSVRYDVIKGDTLWALSESYLRDPFLWPQIIREDGKDIGDPRFLQIGTVLMIGKEIASSYALDVLPDYEGVITPSAKTKDKVGSSLITQENLSNNKPTSYHFYMVKDGLVYAYYKGQHVTIPVEMLKTKSTDVKSLGSNVHIDKALLNSIFKKDI